MMLSTTKTAQERCIREIWNVHIGTYQSGGAPASPFRKCKQSLSKTGQNLK